MRAARRLAVVGCISFEGTLPYLEFFFATSVGVAGGAGETEGAGGTGSAGERLTVLVEGGRGGELPPPTSVHTPAPAPSSCSLCASNAAAAACPGGGGGDGGAGGATGNLLRCTVCQEPCLVADVASSSLDGTFYKS